MIDIAAISKCYGNTGQYVARITGRDKKFTYNREFLGRKNGQRTEALIDEPGIYEDCDIDRKGRKEHGFTVVLRRPADCPPFTPEGDPELVALRATEEQVMALTKRMDAGEAFDDLTEVYKESADADRYSFRIRTPGEAKKASKAMTLEAVIDACWAQIGNLPEREAKAVLKTLKDRVSPPKPKAAADTASAPDAGQPDAGQPDADEIEGQRQNEEDMGEL